MLNAGEYIVKFLEAAGVSRVYCVPGESFLPVLEALRHSPIETLTTRHESAAGYMAVADGRLTGKPGVVMVSRGPGVTNASIAVHTAQQDGLPLLMFVGQVERKNLRRDGFQEIDYSKMFADIAKWTMEVHEPDDLPRILARAYAMSISGTPGPVIISMPEDMLEAHVSEHVAAMPVTVSGPAHSGPSEAAVAEVLKLVSTAQRPLIIAGKEFAEDGAREVLLKLAEKLEIPVVVSFRRHDLFANHHRLYAGDMGMSNTEAQMHLYKSADLVLALGTRLGDLTTHGYTFPASPWPQQPLVHVYNDSSMVGRHYTPVVGAVCKASDFARSLIAHAQPEHIRRRPEWIDELKPHVVKQNTWTHTRKDDGIVFGNLISHLSERLDDNVSIVPDAGISAALVYRYFSFYGQRRLYATMAGVMGFGIPGSIAVALREPHKKVICLVGDGGFMMTGFDLAIAVEKKLPICIFLANNRSLGTIYFHQEKHYPGGSHATALSGPDFKKLAESFGCAAYQIEHEADIAEVVDKALQTEGPVLVDVRTSLEFLKK